MLKDADLQKGQTVFWSTNLKNPMKENIIIKNNFKRNF
jgi:hypothetical protein